MSGSYRPAQAAKPDATRATNLLAERDLVLNVPVNFVTLPGVSLRAACFGRNIFEDKAAAACFSNLVASGFRRFTWDLYWDSVRRVWSFCPAQIPSGVSGLSTSITQPATATTSVPSILSNPASIGALVERHPSPTDSLVIEETSSISATASLNPSSGGPAAAEPTSPVQLSDLVRIGPYQCSRTIDLPVLTTVLSDYIRNTSDTVHAYLPYLTLNLHVAAPAESPTAAPGVVSGTNLPAQMELISSILRINLTQLYTPTDLRTQRLSVNTTWFSNDVQTGLRPSLAYYNLTGKDYSATENGWPSEGYIEFKVPSQRLIVEFGTIDPQLSKYNFSADADDIFPSQYLQNFSTNVSFASAGKLTTGCYFTPTSLDLASNNNSFASFGISSLAQDNLQSVSRSPQSTIPEVANLSSCGISPFLNTTLLNQTADQNPALYESFAHSAHWSFAPTEPRNVSPTEENAPKIRCAAVDSSLAGRWRVVDCTERHYAACRVGESPFSWHLSDTKATYSGSVDVCGSGESFSVPRGPLENAHLAAQIRNESAADQLVLVNFNSLDVAGCWVVGVNATCPYKQTAGSSTSVRRVIVPVVASLIVLIVAALTVFVKGAANRRTTRRKRKRKRKGEDGWDYEGVPS